jgi:NAD(P)-dependent dehydrogenase (short-subunit alcohol dehydrogenase family)
VALRVNWPQSRGQQHDTYGCVPFQFGIGVTNIEPGVILTPIVSKMSQSKKHGESESVPAVSAC